MSKRAHPALVGGFVVGGLILAALAVVLLSEGGLLEQRPRHVMYFEGSVYGLQVGSPVIFRGVKVGTVTDIALHLRRDHMGFSIPVTVRRDPGSLQSPDRAEPVSIAALVEQGLRARLGLQSLITRQLYIEVDFFPERPAVYRSKHPDPTEIPTIPSPLQEIIRRLEDFPLERVLESLATTTESIDRLVSSEELLSVIRSLNTTLLELTELTRTLRHRTDPLATSAQTTLDQARQTLGTADRALERMTELTANDSDLVRNLNTALLDLSRAARSARELTAEDSELAVSMNETLNELRRSARAVRTLANILERQPEALIRGRRSVGSAP